MIYWIFSIAPPTLPLKAAQTLEQFFSKGEVEEYQKFRVEKRRNEWLNSRLLVKQLVAKIVSPEVELSLKSISIHKMDSGVPFVEIEGLGGVGWLSLSHSKGGVLAAFSQDESERFGVDIEFIENRPLNLFADYFTQREINWITSSVDTEKELHSNLIWSAKEAFLKAIEKGLQMDTRKIEIEPFEGQIASANWNHLHFSAEGGLSIGWQLLFRQAAGYILNICLPKSKTTQLVEVKGFSESNSTD